MSFLLLLSVLLTPSLERDTNKEEKRILEGVKECVTKVYYYYYYWNWKGIKTGWEEETWSKRKQTPS